MSFEDALRSVPAGQWQVQQVQALDWYDGPREGVGVLGVPPCEFYFELLDERYHPDGLDDRLFRLDELPPGSVQDVASVLPHLASPREEDRRRARARLDEIKATRRPTPLVVYTRDWQRILGCWSAEHVSNGGGDWFAALGIPQARSA